MFCASWGPPPPPYCHKPSKKVRRGAQPTSELVTAYDPEKPETADRKITRTVIFPNTNRGARARRGEAGGGGGGARV
jgi:hypothetical protein